MPGDESVSGISGRNQWESIRVYGWRNQECRIDDARDHGRFWERTLLNCTVKRVNHSIGKEKYYVAQPS